MAKEFITPDPKFQRQVERLAGQLPPYEVTISLLMSQIVIRANEADIELPEISEGTVSNLNDGEASQLLDELTQQ